MTTTSTPVVTMSASGRSVPHPSAPHVTGPVRRHAVVDEHAGPLDGGYEESVADAPVLLGADAAVAPPVATRPLVATVRRTASRLWNNVSLWSMFDQAIFSGTNFLTVLLIGRFLPAASLGVYQMAMTVVFLGYLVQEAVVVSPYRVFAASKKAPELPSYRGSLLAHLALTSLTSGAMTLSVLLGLLLFWGELPYDGTFFALAAAVPLLMGRDGLRRFALAELEPRRAVLVDGVVAVVQLGGLALLAPRSDFSVAKALALGGTASLVAVMVLAWAWRPTVRLSRRAIGTDFLANWRLGQWSLASILVVNGGPLLAMPWLLTGLCDEVVTGEFAAGMAIAGVTNILLNGIGNIIGPRLARAYVDDGRTGLFRAGNGFMGLLTVTLGGASVAAWLFADEIVPLLYGDKFPQAPMVVILLTVNALAMAWGMVAANSLWAMQLPKRNFVADVVDMIVVLSLTPLLAPSFGAVGAAWAYLLGTIVATAIRIGFALHGLATEPNRHVETLQPGSPQHDLQH